MRCLTTRLSVLLLAISASPVLAQGNKKPADMETLPAPAALQADVQPIDLYSAMKLAGVYNPEILIARQRVAEADARRQLAAAQILPTINAGTNLDHHQGNLQQSTGRIITVNRDSMFFGLGANAVAAGTVNIPGIVWNGNVSDQIFARLVARQVVKQRQFESEAVRNDVLGRVAVAYVELLRATGRRAVIEMSRSESAEVARLTASAAKNKQGRQADADRAAAELQLRDEALLRGEADVQIASARLAQLLRLDPAVRLFPTDGWVVPAPIVPDPIPLTELLAIAITQRPELRARQAAVRAAFLELQAAKALPFSPNFLVGYSTGSFGGGSNLVAQSTGASRFGSFDNRQDFDAVLFWSIKNLGVGNLAMVKLARSNLRQDELRQIEVFDRVRTEVATAHARVHSRHAQIDANEKAVESSQKAFAQDMVRTKNLEGLPIELLDSLRLLERSRLGYLDAIIDYNRAQFELYVALGQPPACVLARPVPASLMPPVESK